MVDEDGEKPEVKKACSMMKGRPQSLYLGLFRSPLATSTHAGLGREGERERAELMPRGGLVWADNAEAWSLT